MEVLEWFVDIPDMSLCVTLILCGGWGELQLAGPPNTTPAQPQPDVFQKTKLSAGGDLSDAQAGTGCDRRFPHHQHYFSLRVYPDTSERRDQNNTSRLY